MKIWQAYVSSLTTVMSSGDVDGVIVAAETEERANAIINEAINPAVCAGLGEPYPYTMELVANDAVVEEGVLLSSTYYG